MKPRAVWPWDSEPPPKPQVIERLPPSAPLLYLPDGTPLTPAPPRVGFVIPPEPRP